MNKITIGIPKVLLYYKYGNLWTIFFEELGCNVLLSPNTNKKILDDGIKLSMDEACIAMKIYLGHVNYLIDKCDYILVPRIKCLKKHEKLCTNFSCLYDLINNLFNVEIINYNVDTENSESELYGFISMGLSLGFHYKQALHAYKVAKKKDEMLNIRKRNKQKSKLVNDKIKILLAGHPYNLYDDMLGKKIINMLEDNNIEIIYSDSYDTKYLEKDVVNISKRNYWTYNKEIIASVSYYQDMVDGIILVTAFPCGPDSLSNEMIVRSVNIPIIELIMDDNNSNTGFETRIESFIDILEERKKSYGRENY